MNQEREVRPNSGVLFSVAAKKTAKSPDYFGDLAIAASSIRVVDEIGRASGRERVYHPV